MQPNVHDAFFKEMLSRPEHAASLLRQILPARIAARLDFASLVARAGSYVDEALKERHSDLLFSVTIDDRSALIRPEELVLRLLAAVGEEGKEEIMTAADQLVERGREQGIKLGRREMLLDQLRERFGVLPDAVIARVTAAGMTELQAWSKRVLTAPGLDEIFAGT